KVWFHVIQQTNGTGSISDSRINAQMTALNEDFLALSGTQGQNGFGTKIRFELEGITRTTNNAWYSDSFNDETAYKTALRRDTSAFLNVYSNDAQGFLGYAYLPPGNAGTFYDGVVILDGSVGGRNNGFSVYDQGRTLTHEVGHYLGLLHTFQGGCSNSFTSGDLVTDTNAEQEPYLNVSASCPSRSTCGNPDPVSNYMDYNRDSCMDRFTSQQSNRMVCSLLNYRPGVVNVVTQQGQVVPLSAIMLLLDS
ncbi:MAG: zinc metalloprotease, partial [Pseudomonadota bacterium]